MDASFPPARFKRFLSGITLFFIALTFIILSSFHDAYSARVTLEWDPNTEPDLAGYKLYYGTASGYAQVIDVGNTTMYTVTNLTAGVTYYFAVTAHDASGHEKHTYTSL